MRIEHSIESLTRGLCRGKPSLYDGVLPLCRFYAKREYARDLSGDDPEVIANTSRVDQGFGTGLMRVVHDVSPFKEMI
ncbi:MAG: hypothetical protein HYT41_01360 [Candidatus Sungbacteria bacterium]|nr:hypothetical protein [Candidatus Sungbacteria bacterium]